jgi:4-diphosphocytidyl-2-C-methyl-D-erythritol kinase
VSGGGALVERAPAKINLTLRVVGRRADGYHLLDSLVAFASVADELSLWPGSAVGLSVRGPTAAAAGPIEENLVLKASRELAARLPGLRLGRFLLRKRLPVAAGMGGGSSDAAAALRLLARLNGLALGAEPVLEAAAATGADVPVCLLPVARRMQGVGDILSAPVTLPPLPGVLVNPGLPAPTADVFRALGRLPEPAASDPPPPEGGPEDLIRYLHGSGNDLEGAGASVVPAVADALSRLAAQPGCRLARMSGSGATVFGLFESTRLAANAARHLRCLHPDWWIRTARIG